MPLEFTSRKPQARKDVVTPLNEVPAATAARERPAARVKARPKEVGGPGGLEPTRYGDWERKGICVDF